MGGKVDSSREVDIVDERDRDREVKVWELCLVAG